MKSRWFNRAAPSLAHRPPELELLAEKYDPWLKRGQPKKRESSKAEAEAESSIFDQSQGPFQLYENQHVRYTNYLKRNQASRYLNEAQVGPSSLPYRNSQDLLFEARRYKPKRRTDDNGMDRWQLVREDVPTQRTAGTLEDDNIDFIMELARKELVQNCLRTRRQNIPKPQVYAPVSIQSKQESKEWELMSQKRGHKFKIPRLVPGTLHNPIFVDHDDTSLPMSSSVLLRSPSDFSRRSTSPYAASSSRSVEAVASSCSSNSVTHDQQHTLFDNFEAFMTVNDLEQNIKELSDFLGLPDDSGVETFDNNAGELNDGILQNFDVSEYILNSPMSENISVDSSNSRYETIQNQINIENNYASNQDEFAHNNDYANNNSSSAEFFPSCVGDELASLWGISCDP